MSRLTPLQHAYLIGYKRAQKLALRDLAELSDRFDEEIKELLDEIRALRVEMARMHMIDNAVKAERDADALLQ